MFYFVYVLRSEKDGNLYIGSTSSLNERLKEHSLGLTPSLKGRLPMELIYYEALPTKDEAIKREEFYKSGRGHEVLYKILFKTLKEKSRVWV